MKLSPFVFKLIICSFIYVLTGCSAVVPLESTNKDVEAKKFKTVENKSNIYVVRTCEYGQKLHDVSLDDGTRISLGCQNYVVFSTMPGVHRISASSSENREMQEIITKGGENYFVEMGWKMGSGTGDVKVTVSQLNAEEGMQAIRNSQLISLNGY